MNTENLAENKVALLTVGGFLLITLIVGLLPGNKAKTMRDYALANKSFGPIVLSMTFLATYIDGSDIQSLPATIFSNGIVQLVSRVGEVLGFLFFGWIIAPKILNFRDAITLGDIAHDLFGESAQIITGIASFLSGIIWSSIQVLMLGYIGSSLLGMDARYMVLIGGSIMIIYSSIGGVRAVTLTDVIQFTVLFFGGMILLTVVLHQAGGLEMVFKKLASSFPDRLQVFGHPNFKLKSLHSITNFLCLVFFIPSIMQRILMASSKREVKQMLVISTILRIVFLLAITFLALSALVMFPGTPPQDIIIHLTKTFFPKHLHGIFALGMIAVVMSSVDSQLSAGGLVLTHDVIKPICKKFQIQINELNIVK